MLSQLKVQNFAIIDNLIVNFNEGFTTLTGETGAGKSLIIDAIGLLFGDRSSSMMIRTGETKATVEGIFENVSEYTKQVLDNLQIELLDSDIVVIKREISTTGKNLIRANGEIITLTQLELLASTLGDIHTQDETHKLFDQHNYLTFIDDEKVASLLAEYTTLRKNYLSLYKAYQSVLELSRNDNSNLEFWEYQYKELEKANDNDRVYLEQNGQAIMMKAYKLTINDTEYEIGIAELDEKINEFGKILSIDNKTGIIIRTGSSNVPLDASILVDKYELNEKEIEYLTNIGYESINSYNLKLYSKILDKVISEFNNKSEILIPIDNIDTTDLKVIYLSDDGKTHETYDIKKVTYEGKNYISFSTGHFSNYVLVQSTIKNPNTGDNIYYLFILLTISILGTLYIKKKCN